MIRINANLFRIANLSVSTEETRYYLNGVFVEPHHSGKGATLTATDGHRLISIYDENGVCDAPAIVKLSAEALKSCKPSKHDPAGTVRVVHVDVVSSCGNATVVVGTFADSTSHLPAGEFVRAQTVAVSERCIIDGHFPDYRRVIDVGPQKGEPTLSAFNQQYVAEFCEIARELFLHGQTGKAGRDYRGQILLTGATHGNPALISFPNSPIAFGVLMPMRIGDRTWRPEVPAWFAPRKLQAAA